MSHIILCIGLIFIFYDPSDPLKRLICQGIDGLFRLLQIIKLILERMIQAHFKIRSEKSTKPVDPLEIPPLFQ